MKKGKTGKTRKNEKTKNVGKRAGKYGNEEGTGRYGTGLQEGRERADGKKFSVPAHIFGINPCFSAGKQIGGLKLSHFSQTPENLVGKTTLFPSIVYGRSSLRCKRR
jgi:hypothetical protein